MSATKSFFNITTGRSHGVVPASDAVRIALDSGATLTLDKAPPCSCRPPDGCSDCEGPKLIRARATWPAADEGDRDGRPIEAKGERVDKVLSALVGELILGEAGVEVTEWTVPPEGADTPHVQFGRVGVPWFVAESEDDVAQRLLKCVEVARRDQGDRINAVVVRVRDRGEVGIACLPEKPEPPVGATLTGRRMAGGSPWADVPWDQVVGMGRVGLVRRAVDRVRRDCELAGLDVPSRIPRLFLLGAGVPCPSAVTRQLSAAGRTFPLDSLSWAVEDDVLARIVDKVIGVASGGKPVALRVKAVRRPA